MPLYLFICLCVCLLSPAYILLLTHFVVLALAREYNNQFSSAGEEDGS